MQKIKFYLLITSLLFYACQQTPPDQQASQVSVERDSITAPVEQAAVQNTQMIDGELILLHGADTLAFEHRTEDLAKYLGKPDKVDVNTIECGGYFETNQSDPGQAQVHHYGGSSFEVYGPRAVMMAIDFQDGKLKANLGGILLDRTITVEKFQQLYPQADLGNSNQKEADKTESVRLQAGNSDDAWMFRFVNGKLAKLEYYIPC